MAVRIVLVDDHEVVRRGVADVLREEADLEVVAEAGSVAEAIARVRQYRPEIVILDVRLPDGSGVEACREIRSWSPDTRVIMLTSYADDEALFASILAGASGYVLKQIRMDDLLAAIRCVAAGGSLLDPAVTERVLRRLRGEDRSPADKAFDALTERERDILVLIAEGLSNRQIAERVFLAEKTVKNYVSSILMKLGLSRRTEAVAMVGQLRTDRASVRPPETWPGGRPAP